MLRLLIVGSLVVIKNLATYRNSLGDIDYNTVTVVLSLQILLLTKLILNRARSSGHD
jgi:hypothetical protein